MASRDYGAARSEVVEGSPLQFTVAGETFDIPRPLPALPIFDFFDLDTSDLYELFKGSWKFLKEVVRPGDLERLDRTLRAAQSDMTSIWNIAQGIIEDATGRPTEGHASSPSLPSNDGQSSRPAASRKGSPRSKSQRASA